MTWFSLALAVLLSASGLGLAAEPSVFERDSWPVPETELDRIVLAALGPKGIEPARPCSDAVFVRRVHLGLIGALPEPSAVAEFLRDERSDKRSRLIERLLAAPDFADYWALKWCDLLRVKAEFPINLWPNAVQAYHRWIWEAEANSMPYDQFARELLTSSGSNFRVPPTNFYRAVQNRKPAGLAEAAALAFMGTRLATWPEARRAQLDAFFSRVAYKGTDEWKEEIVYCAPAQEALAAQFPDGKHCRIGPGDDPRAVFADWLLAPGNAWFARSLANRTWSWLFGRGIVHETDDMRPDNPPSNPRLLDYLARELAAAKYDRRHLFRLILNSRTYQQSPIPRSEHPGAGELFACFPVHQLDAEVLADALNWIGGAKEQYESRIPEPFTWIPQDERTIALADGSITSTFLQMFGRPSRDTGLEGERARAPTDAQRLFLLNSTDVQRRIENSIRLRSLAAAAGGDLPRLVRDIYLALLAREPTQGELAAAQAYAKGSKGGATAAMADLAWALLNSMEFLYQH